jgi:hypothetical protein
MACRAPAHLDKPEAREAGTTFAGTGQRGSVDVDEATTSEKRGRVAQKWIQNGHSGRASSVFPGFVAIG